MSLIKIYFENKVVFLCDSLNAKLNNLSISKDTFYTEDISENSLVDVIYKIHETQYRQAIIMHHDLKELQSKFFAHFEIIQAGGGLVHNKKGEILFIFRRGKWDLPKGKLEPGESIELCAEREVMEETGLQHIEMGKKLATTYHTYSEHGKLILKESHWYAMRTLKDEVLQPQIEEQITEIKWVPKNELNYYLENSFGAIKDVIRLVKSIHF